jgi:hypothetical protein
MTEATNSLSRHKSIMKPLVFEIAFAVSLCIWIVTLMAWALA